LSSISSEALWEQTGRLSKIGSEVSPKKKKNKHLFMQYVLTDAQLFRFSDRKEGKYLLAPTHEEEVTALVARSVKSYKNLPLRLYQISKTWTLTIPVYELASLTIYQHRNTEMSCVLVKASCEAESSP
jgi:prolyl-tRNA synthetase